MPVLFLVWCGWLIMLIHCRYLSQDFFWTWQQSMHKGRVIRSAKRAYQKNFLPIKITIITNECRPISFTNHKKGLVSVYETEANMITLCLAYTLQKVLYFECLRYQTMLLHVLPYLMSLKSKSNLKLMCILVEKGSMNKRDQKCNFCTCHWQGIIVFIPSLIIHWS